MARSDSRRSRLNRHRRLGVESLEERRVLTVFINELMLDSFGGNNETDQFVEIRNDTLEAIPPNTFLVFVDGDGDAAGEVHTVFNLSNLETGSNGILTLLQQGHPYDVRLPGNAIVSTTEGFGGLPIGVFQTDSVTSDSIDSVTTDSIDSGVGSNTVFLIESTIAPSVNLDIDQDNDGVADSGTANWTVLDSISLLQEDGFGYSNLAYESGAIFQPLAFANPGDGTAIVVEGATHYAARAQDSSGRTPGDWVVGAVVEITEGGRRRFRITQGFFGNPEPLHFAGRFLDHVNESNFHGAFSGLVTNAAGDGIANTTVYVDENGSGLLDEETYTVRPGDFTETQELTNAAPRATLTIAEADNRPGSFDVVRPLLQNPDDTSPSIFGSGMNGALNSASRLRIDFPESASSVSATFLGATTSYGRLEIFNSAGESLQFQRTPPLLTGELQSLTIQRNQADIAYAVAYSDDDFFNSSPFGTVTELSYDILEQNDRTDSDGAYMIDFIESGTYELRVEGSSASAFRSVGNSEHVRNVDFGGSTTEIVTFEDTTFSVPEDAPIRTQIGTLVANNPSGDNLNFEIIDGNEQGLFWIEPDSGTLLVAEQNRLDFETASVHVLTVAVRGSGNPFVDTGRVTINVTNSNEVPTDVTLDNNQVVGNIAGAVVGDFVVADADGGETYEYTLSDDRFEVVGNTLRLRAGEFVTIADSPIQMVVELRDRSGFELTRGILVEVVASSTAWHNPFLDVDVDADSGVSPIDALRIINELSQRTLISANGTLPAERPATFGFLDVNNDGFLAPIDAIIVINRLNAISNGQIQAASDSVFAALSVEVENEDEEE